MPDPLQQRPRLLIIDDDRDLCRLIRDYLEPLGYEVSAAYNGADGLERALGETWSAVILDVMLPGLNGFDVLKRLRVKSNVPVLMLTARGDESDRIAGLEVGADDYLPKTFSTRELLARLRAVTRRAVEGRGGAPRRLEVLVDQDHPCPRFDQGAGDARPDAQRPAGHRCATPSEIET